MLGGSTTGDLSTKTSHLIADFCDPSSEKYTVSFLGFFV